jgi:RNA polymerase sigma-70 factor (ECF subfamily)
MATPQLPRHGRHQEFERVALPHLQELLGAALRLTKNPRDAEDLVQDAFLKAYTFFDKFEAGTNCRAWLFKILHNTFINGYRRRLRERRTFAPVEAEFLERASQPEEPPCGVDPNNDEIGRYFSDDVKHALKQLPPDFRAAVVMADVHDLSYKEIAKAMGCPAGTVMSRLFRGRRLLQALLGDYARRQRLLSPPAEAKAPEVAPAPPIAEERWSMALEPLEKQAA